MQTNILVTASALSDQDLLARLEVLAGTEREASAELVAHLAALDSDPGAIFDRALTVLLEKVEKTKLAAAAKPRPFRPIRPETDDKEVRKPGLPSRPVPREVKRAVWERDAGRCAFVSSTGRRCTERTFLEFHHIQPYAMQGPATIANLSIRCWRHNQHEAALIFGPHGTSIVREARPSP